MAEFAPAVSFIIWTYNRARYLDETIESLRKHPDLERPFEILVVDNNSTDLTSKVVKTHQAENTPGHVQIRYVFEKKQGLSHARNRGIEEAASECLVFFDDDILATEGLVPAWCDFFEREPGAIAGGGKINVHFDGPRPKWLSHFLMPLLGHHDLGEHQKEYPRGKYPFGGNMGFRKDVFDKVEAFNTELGRKGQILDAGEEKELFRRVRNLEGKIVYLPDAFLYHRVNSDRLSKDYIRKQARGVGQSRKLKMQSLGGVDKYATVAQEVAKAFVTIPLLLFYLLRLAPSRGVMLVRFRKWVWEGMFS